MQLFHIVVDCLLLIVMLIYLLVIRRYIFVSKCLVRGIVPVKITLKSGVILKGFMMINDIRKYHNDSSIGGVSVLRKYDKDISIDSSEISLIEESKVRG